MAGGYSRMIIGGVMIGIFVTVIAIFMVQFAVDNESDISLADDSRYSNLNSTNQQRFANYSSQSEESQETLFATTLEAGDEHAATGAQFKIGPLTAMALAIGSFGTAFNSIFGPEFSFVAIAFISLITFIIGYFTIKAWLGRSPD